MYQPLQAVFHGHIHKKQVRDAGGRKPQDKSWRPLYAAIHGHQLVFYKDFKDAFAVSYMYIEISISAYIMDPVVYIV